MIYLYIKQHTITGLKYFGKTISKDPFRYKGSGKYWKRHINMHGKDFIQTLDIFGFDSQELCTEFALKFSKSNDIIQSKEWANLKEENGLDGGQKGYKHRDETKVKLSKLNKGKILTQEHKDKVSKSLIGRSHSNQHKANMSK